MPDSDQPWLPTIIAAINDSFGEATLPRIYDWVFRNRSNLPNEYKSVIRAIIYSHSSDAEAFRPGNPDVFKQITRGVWAVRHINEMLIGKSHEALQSLAASQMSRDEITSAVKDGRFFEALEEKVKTLQMKYKM